MNRFSKALTSHRDKLARGEKGFTLIELLIVVIIIGVLAAIAIPIYLNVQATAKENSAKTSVTDAKTAVVAYFTQNGTYPDSLAQAGYTVDTSTASADILTDYTHDNSTDPATFCIAAKYGSSGKIFKVTSTTALQSGASAMCS